MWYTDVLGLKDLERRQKDQLRSKILQKLVHFVYLRFFTDFIYALLHRRRTHYNRPFPIPHTPILFY